MNKKAKQAVVPFIHFDLEYKNQLLNYARLLKDTKKLETDLASAVIYASFAEYVASFVLNNLRHIAYIHTYNSSSAIAYLDQRKDPLDRPISYFIDELRHYSFPDKQEFINLLDEIKNCRNDLFHDLAKSTKDDLIKVATNIKSIQDDVELLVNKLNVISRALEGLYPKVINPPQNKNGTP